MLSHVTPWTAARQAPLSMDFSRQEYWNGLSFPSPFSMFKHRRKIWKIVAAVQLLSCVRLFATPRTAACQAVPELAQTHVRWVGDATQPSLLSSSPPVFYLSQHHVGKHPVSELCTSGGQSIGDSPLATVLLMNIQGWFPLGWTGLISFQSKGLSRVFSTVQSTTVQKHQDKSKR